MTVRPNWFIRLWTGLWRMTFKRVLIVYNANFVSKSTIMGCWPESLRLRALFIATYSDTEPSFQMFEIDKLSQKEFSEVVALCNKISAEQEHVKG